MNKDTAMTQQESEVMIKELSKVFDVVRLLDEETLETGNIKDITDAEGFPCNAILFGRREPTVRTVLPETLFVKKMSS